MPLVVQGRLVQSGPISLNAGLQIQPGGIVEVSSTMTVNSILDIQLSGVLQISSGSLSNLAGSSGTVVNRGTIRKTSAGSATVSLLENLGGTVDVQAGTFTLSGTIGR